MSSTRLAPGPSTGYRFTPAMLVVVVALGAAVAGITLGIGPWALLIVPLLVGAAATLGNLPASFLVFVCLLPTLGNWEFARYQPEVWLSIWVGLLGLVAVSWLLTAAASPTRITLHGPLTLAYGAFLLVALVSWSIRPEFGPTTIESGVFAGVRRAVWEPLLMSGLLVLSMSAIRSERQLRRLFWVIVITAVPYCLTIYGFSIREIEVGGVAGRRWGLFPDVHPAATYMLFATILALSLVQHATRRQRWLLIACVTLFLGSQWLTTSRTTMVAIAVVIVVGFLIEGAWKQLLVVGVAGATALVLAYPLLPLTAQVALSQIVAAFQLRGDPSAVVTGVNTFGYRMIDVEDALVLAGEYPWLGVGLGNHTYALPGGPRLLHVYYMRILVETGLLGFVAFATIIGIVMWLALRALRRCRASGRAREYVLVRGLTLSFVAILVVFLTQPGLDEGGRLFWMLGGLVVAMDSVIRSMFAGHRLAMA